jgi:hypothetical protein
LHIASKSCLTAQNGHQSYKLKIFVQLSQVKLLEGFRHNFTGVISTIGYCASCWYILLHCIKWPPELQIEKSCPAFTGQTAYGISMKLNRNVQCHPKLWQKALLYFIM